MKAKTAKSGDFELAPAGMHLAVLYQIIDLGTQTWMSKDFGQQIKPLIRFAWEIPAKKNKEGQPLMVFSRYTNSSHEKSGLYKAVMGWKGVKVGHIDLKSLLGEAANLNIIHTVDGDKTYANIVNIVPLMEGQAVPKPYNAPKLLSLEPGEYDYDIFLSLAENTRNTVALSPEWKKVNGDLEESGGVVAHPVDDDLDDLIPF